VSDVSNTADPTAADEPIAPGSINAQLAALTARLSTPRASPDIEPLPQSFDDILRQQEQALTRGEGDMSATGQGQLNAIHHFRESLVKRNADKRVTQLIEEIPEDAGPLNPQKLIVQSLASMRDLSPHYLNRFVAYIDTLLWLEEAGGK